MNVTTKAAGPQGGLVLRSPNSKGGAGGFTLVEMMVVIVIIVILFGIVGMVMTGVIDRSRFANASALVGILNKGCEEYRVEYKAYPPDSPYKGSQNLHYYLGKQRKKIVQFRADGAHVMQDAPPITNFRLDMLAPGSNSIEPKPPRYVHDIWGRPVEYVNPGRKNTRGVDLWSRGRDAVDPVDDVWPGER